MTTAEFDQNGLSGLQDELRYLLNRWDPIGVYDELLDCPRDEYDCLIVRILTRLASHESRASFSEYLWNEIEPLRARPCSMRNRRVRRPPSGLVCGEERGLLTPTKHPVMPRWRRRPGSGLEAAV